MNAFLKATLGKPYPNFFLQSIKKLLPIHLFSHYHMPLVHLDYMITIYTSTKSMNYQNLYITKTSQFTNRYVMNSKLKLLEHKKRNSKKISSFEDFLMQQTILNDWIHKFNYWFYYEYCIPSFGLMTLFLLRLSDSNLVHHSLRVV